MRSSGTRCRSRSCPSWPRRPAACAHGAPAPPCGHPRDVRARPGAGGRHRRARGGTSPLAGLPFPAVATNVSYVDGVTGGNVFVMTLEGARRVAAAMMGMTVPDPATAGAIELTEL